MTDQIQTKDHPPLLSDEATRDRWNWVHRAISTAKSRNAEVLLATEAVDGRAPRQLRVAKR